LLHGQLGSQDATFMGPDAGNSQVGVRYVGGDVLIAIEARLRGPLTASTSACR
jgi:hypothetical protein